MEHGASVIKQNRARCLTHSIVDMIMHQKCAADKESVFVESVFVVRAAKSPTISIMGSSVNAMISVVISTKDSSVEVMETYRLYHCRVTSITYYKSLISYLITEHLLLVLPFQGRVGVSAGCANVFQDLVVEHASALSAWSLVCHRMERFVRAEGSASVAHAVATTTASKVRLVSFAPLAPASVPCTGTITFLVHTI